MDLDSAKGNGLSQLFCEVCFVIVCDLYLQASVSIDDVLLLKCLEIIDLDLLIFPRWGSRCSNRLGSADTGPSSP